MLVTFAVSNFRSIADRQSITFQSRNDDTNEESLISFNGLNVGRTAAIFGANASGKSNLLKAIGIARAFILNSVTGLTLGDPIPGMKPFRLDPKWAALPSTFEFIVEIGESIYEYSFAATSDRVHLESLYIKKPGGHRTKKFSRSLNQDTGLTSWEWKGFAKKDEELLTEKTRENMLLLSRAADFNFDQLGKLFLWFKNAIRPVDFSEPPPILAQQTAQKAMDDQVFRARVLSLIRDADMGISDLQVREEDVSFPNDMPDAIKSMMAALAKSTKKGKLSTFNVSTTHFDTDGNPHLFSLNADESNGTQRFFAIAGLLLDALRDGAVLVIDELDCSMHPNLTRKIVELFNCPLANHRGAQMMFATHDVSLLDAKILRRDQFWFTDKSQFGKTDVFSLYDVGSGDDKPRKGEAFLKHYLLGHYGGVPNFGPLLEDMELEWPEDNERLAQPL